MRNRSNTVARCHPIFRDALGGVVVASADIRLRHLVGDQKWSCKEARM